MQSSRHRGSFIDVCPDCEGIFLSPGEAEKVHGVNHAEAFAEGGFATLVGPSELECPGHEDGMKMAVYTVSALAEPVEVDVCAACGGLYLDPGEGAVLAQVARIARISDEDEASVTRPEGSGRFLPPPDVDAQARVIADARREHGRSGIRELWAGLVSLVTGQGGGVAGVLGEKGDFELERERAEEDAD